jgi:AcrR family transcriptional regulator
MAPRQTVTRGRIGEAAFEIVSEEGMQALTARNVAQRLGVSTQPIYVYFSSMKDLRREVIRRAKKMMLSYTAKPYTDRLFLNIGIGAVFFARDHRTLYRFLFMENDRFKDLVADILDTCRREMKKDGRFAHMTQGERNALFDTLWVYVYGLASLICVGLIDEDSDRFIIDAIERMGTDIIAAAIRKGPDKKKRT